MTRQWIYLLLILQTTLLNTGCHNQSTIDRQTVFVEASQTPDVPKPVIKQLPVPVASPQLRPLPDQLGDRKDEGSVIDPKQARDAVSAAKKQATHRPDQDGFIEAVQMYDYLEGVVYEVYASPGHVTTIRLQPGEKLIAKAVGNSAQWVVHDTRTGSGHLARSLLLLKPLKPYVETNLMVSTNRRVYQIDLKSLPDVYHSAVAWNYPVDLITQLIERHHIQNQESDRVIDGGITIESLDFGYAIKSKSKKKPRWMPKRVFHDGSKTYIQFSRDLAATEAPPLFVLNEQSDDSQAQLVNYRVKNNYYIVDQVIERAQLRLGKQPQQFVTIKRRNR